MLARLMPKVDKELQEVHLMYGDTDGRRGENVAPSNFPMKFESKKGRTTTNEWYGKAGFSWFIGVFTRRIVVDGCYHYQHTKYVCVVDSSRVESTYWQSQSSRVAVTGERVKFV